MKRERNENMSDKKQILFLDLDDTLLTTDKKITPGNKAAIAAALKAGRKIVICTGRPLCGTGHIIEELNLQQDGCYAISFNGAQITDCFRNRTIKIDTLPMDHVRYLFAEADKEKIHAQTYDSHYLLCRSEDEETVYYAARTLAPLKLIPELPDGMTEEPAKMLLADLHSHQKLEDFRARHAEWARGKVSLVFSSEFYLEVVKEGVSKGSAIRYLCDYLQIPASETVGAGDSENDIAMLKACSTGCAMANATEACKAAADYVTKLDCNHDGTAEIIEKFLL